MQPQSGVRFRWFKAARSRAATRRIAASIAASLSAVVVCAAAAGPAHAIVGGAEDAGPLSAATVMVLASNGGACSGVVVSPTAILTAAHCVDGDREVRVHYMQNGAPVLLVPGAVVRHPRYARNAVKARTQSVDLALVRLGAPLPSRFQAAPLRAVPMPRAGADITVAGYGAVGAGRADGRFRSVSLPVVEPWGPGKLLLWLGAPDQRPAGPCMGDSGGPATLGGDVVAITAWSEGARGAPCGKRAQAVLLAPHQSWIDATLAGWNTRAHWR